MLRPDRMEPCLSDSPCQIRSHYCCLRGICPLLEDTSLLRRHVQNVAHQRRPSSYGSPQNNPTIWIRDGITARPLITACISPLLSTPVNSSDCALNKVISVKCQRQEGKPDQGRPEQKQSRKVTGDNWGRNERKKSVKSNAEGHEERLAKEIGREAKQEEITVWE